MAADIKGITVEIGGDTTKLGKALADVNKKTKSLSSELGQINKLLKLDPGNADLLAQKQKVLADAIAETSKKLDVLRAAEQQVQEQFEKGDVSEEQFRAVQREAIAAAKKLETYERAWQETAEAMDKAEAGSNEAAQGAKEAGQESSQAADKVDDLADSAKDVGEAGSGAGSALKGAFVGGLKAVAAAAGAALAALAAAAESTREYREAMGKLDSAFTSSGHSSAAAADTYKALQGVIGETDQSVEAAQQIALLANSEKDAAAWAEQAAGVVGKFGDALQPETFYESANETMKLGEATGAYTQMLEGCGMSVEKFNEGLAACKTEGEKQAYMLKVTEEALGSAGDAYRKNNAEIIRANEANEAWTSSLAGVGGAVEPVISDLKLMGASILSDLVPGVQKLAEAFRGLINGDAGAASEFGAALSGILTQLLGKITEMAPSMAQAAVGLLTSLTTTLISMLPQLLTTGVQVIMALLDGITQAIPQVTQALVTMIPQLTQALVTGIPQLIQGGVQLLLALLQAIPQVIPPLVAALPQIVMALVNGLLTAIPQLLTGAVQFFMAIVQAIPQILAVLLPQIPTIVSTICNGLISNVPLLLDAAISLFMALVQAIPQTVAELGRNLPQILTAIKDVFMMVPSIIGTALATVTEKIRPWAQSLGTKAREAGSAFLTNIVTFFQQLPGKIGSFLSNIITRVATWAGNLIAKAAQTGSQFVTKVATFFQQLPGRIGSALTSVINRAASWASNMVAKATDVGRRFVSSVGSFLQGLPGKVATWLSSALSRVSTWASNLVSKGKQAASNLVSAVVNGIRSLPDKMLSIGSDIVSGLWNGITNMMDWLKTQITGLGDMVLQALKSVLKIQSPSRETTWMGEMLVQGLARGVQRHSAEAINSMEDVGARMLDAAAANMGGLDFERALTAPRVVTTAAGAAGADPAAQVLGKLDAIYARLTKLQVVLDSGALVGGILDKVDAGLAVQQQLRARGV